MLMNRLVEANGKRSKLVPELESLIRDLGVAMFTEKTAVITVWSEEEDLTFVGKITTLDKLTRTIRVESVDEYTWIPFDDVLNIDIIVEDCC
jgi:hypothetical protein